MSQKDGNREVMRFVGLGTQWMVMLSLATYAGYHLDKKTGWKFPIFIITLPLVALGLSLYQLIKTLNKPKKKK